MTSSQCKSPSSPKRTIATYRYGRCRRSAGVLSLLPLSSCLSHPLAKNGHAVVRGPLLSRLAKAWVSALSRLCVSWIQEWQRAALATSASQSLPAVPVVPSCLRVIISSPQTSLENPPAFRAKTLLGIRLSVCPSVPAELQLATDA